MTNSDVPKPAAPERDRPQLPPGYQISEIGEGMFQWSEVDAWLTAARVYWLGTASADGEPHATPIWGAWVGGAVYFDGYYERTRWGRNLAANPRIVVHIESGNRVVIMKGIARIVNVEPDLFEQVTNQWLTKYNQRPDTSEGMYCVRPHTVFAWDNDAFGKTATRWRLSTVY